MITDNRNISAHFHSSEFKCQHCGGIYIQEELVNKLEKLFKKLNASKCIISSGYRCPTYDKQIGGFVGKHAQGLAADCCYYDKDGKVIPSKIVICAAWDMKLLGGIANIDGNYVHLDNRPSGTYYGDERVSNNSCWTNPYNYFKVTKQDVANYTGEVVTNDVNVFYRVKTLKHGWLSEVKNLEDYAGWEDSPITAVAMGVDKGSIKYRVHIKGGDWLPYVTGYNINDIINGFGGDGVNVIDLVEVYYNTPDTIRPYKKAKYKVNNYPYQYDNETTNGQDGYAGEIGVAVTKFQIIIE